MHHEKHSSIRLLGSISIILSSFRLACGHTLETYQWLSEHPVTLQSRFSLIEGHSHVAHRRQEEWTGVEAGRPLSLSYCLSAFEVSCSLKIKHAASHGRDWEPLKWNKEIVRWRGCRRDQGSLRKPEEHIVFELPILRHVMFSYLFPLPPFFPHLSPPNFTRLPALQLEDMIAFPCWDSL